MSAKRCPDCERTLPLSAFYRSARQISTRCKSCHNAACQRRAKGASYRARHAVAKRRWQRANAVAKRIHEGRSIVLHRADVPGLLHELERTVMRLAGEEAAA